MDTKRRKSHHDRHADHLFDLIESDYLMILRNVQYKLPDRILGEIDILAIRKDELDIYEVKCSYRIFKARKQLKKIKKLLSPKSRVRHTFFYCGESKKLIKVSFPSGFYTP